MTTTQQTFLGAAGPLNCDTCYGTLTINDVLLHTPAWCLTDLSDLWGSFDYRGSNRVIPGRRGRKPYVLRPDQTRYSLPFLIIGAYDENGNPYYDEGAGYEDEYFEAYEHGPNVLWQEGLETNVAFLQTAFALDDPSAVAESVFDAEFTLPSGTIRTSRVQVLALRGQLNPGGFMAATLEILDVDAGLMVKGV